MLLSVSVKQKKKKTFRSHLAEQGTAQVTFRAKCWHFPAAKAHIPAAAVVTLWMGAVKSARVKSGQMRERSGLKRH